MYGAAPVWAALFLCLFTTPIVCPQRDVTAIGIASFVLHTFSEPPVIRGGGIIAPLCLLTCAAGGL